MSESSYIAWHDSEATKKQRQHKNGHKSAVIRFTELSRSGKSTASVALERELFNEGKWTYRLDGDNVCHGPNKDLGSSPEDRSENIRRIGEAAKLMVDAEALTVTAFISPYREDRKGARVLLEDNEFIEVYTRCDVEECEKKDLKGSYKKARSGEISESTGISAPYQAPENPEITVDTEHDTTEQLVVRTIRYLKEYEYIQIDISLYRVGGN